MGGCGCGKSSRGCCGDEYCENQDRTNMEFLQKFLHDSIDGWLDDVEERGRAPQADLITKTHLEAMCSIERVNSEYITELLTTDWAFASVLVDLTSWSTIFEKIIARLIGFNILASFKIVNSKVHMEAWKDNSEKEDMVCALDCLKLLTKRVTRVVREQNEEMFLKLCRADLEENHLDEDWSYGREEDALNPDSTFVLVSVLRHLRGLSQEDFQRLAGNSKALGKELPDRWEDSMLSCTISFPKSFGFEQCPNDCGKYFCRLKSKLRQSGSRQRFLVKEYFDDSSKCFLKVIYKMMLLNLDAAKEWMLEGAAISAERYQDMVVKITHKDFDKLDLQFDYEYEGRNDEKEGTVIKIEPRTVINKILSGKIREFATGPIRTALIKRVQPEVRPEQIPGELRPLRDVVEKPSPFACSYCGKDVHPMVESYCKLQCCAQPTSCELSVHRECFISKMEGQGFKKKREYKNATCIASNCSQPLLHILEYDLDNVESVYLKCSEVKRNRSCSTSEKSKRHTKMRKIEYDTASTVLCDDLEEFQEEYHSESESSEHLSREATPLPYDDVEQEPKQPRPTPLSLDFADRAVPIQRKVEEVTQKYEIDESVKEGTPKRRNKKAKANRVPLSDFQFHIKRTQNLVSNRDFEDDEAVSRPDNDASDQNLKNALQDQPTPNAWSSSRNWRQRSGTQAASRRSRSRPSSARFATSGDDKEDNFPSLAKQLEERPPVQERIRVPRLFPRGYVCSARRRLADAPADPAPSSVPPSIRTPSVVGPSNCFLFPSRLTLPIPERAAPKEPCIANRSQNLFAQPDSANNNSSPNGTVSDSPICAICLESLVKEHEATTTEICSLCHKCFHQECISKWHEQSTTCPRCRNFWQREEDYPPLPKKH